MGRTVGLGGWWRWGERILEGEESKVGDAKVAEKIARGSARAKCKEVGVIAVYEATEWKNDGDDQSGNEQTAEVERKDVGVEVLQVKECLVRARSCHCEY